MSVREPGPHAPPAVSSSFVSEFRVSARQVQVIICKTGDEPLVVKISNLRMLLQPFLRALFQGVFIIASLISSLLHSHVTLNLKWCDKIKLSNLLFQV